MVFTTIPLDSLLASVSSDSESLADSSLDIPPMACASLSGITAAFQIWALPSPLAVKAYKKEKGN